MVASTNPETLLALAAETRRLRELVASISCNQISPARASLISASSEIRSASRVP
jgi:hypothetical protein